MYNYIFNATSWCTDKLWIKVNMAVYSTISPPLIHFLNRKTLGFHTINRKLFNNRLGIFLEFYSSSLSIPCL